ncbi:MAG: sigma-70 family RNA polymerase sigma factor [Sedimentisphaerales bacterium]|nr:sigma-70 family RNA polymerase sigma factor [Sedimentisphaerales bacterium]
MIVGIYKSERAIRVDEESQSISPVSSEPEVFVQLYRRHYDEVFRYCAHRLFDRQTAEDVTSQVFIKAVENFHSFKGSEQQFCFWLFRIATNAVNQHLRRQMRGEKMLQHAHEQVISNVASDSDLEESSHERLAALKDAMLSLKPRYQTIITLRFFENLKPTEIAEVLGSSPGTIRSQLARALVKLRKKLATDDVLS